MRTKETTKAVRQTGGRQKVSPRAGGIMERSTGLTAADLPVDLDPSHSPYDMNENRGPSPVPKGVPASPTPSSNSNTDSSYLSAALSSTPTSSGSRRESRTPAGKDPHQDQSAEGSNSSDGEGFEVAAALEGPPLQPTLVSPRARELGFDSSGGEGLELGLAGTETEEAASQNGSGGGKGKRGDQVRGSRLELKAHPTKSHPTKSHPTKSQPTKSQPRAAYWDNLEAQRGKGGMYGEQIEVVGYKNQAQSKVVTPFRETAATPVGVGTSLLRAASAFAQGVEKEVKYVMGGGSERKKNATSREQQRQRELEDSDRVKKVMHPKQTRSAAKKKQRGSFMSMTAATSASSTGSRGSARGGAGGSSSAVRSGGRGAGAGGRGAGGRGAGGRGAGGRGAAGGRTSGSKSSGRPRPEGPVAKSYRQILPPSPYTSPHRSKRTRQPISYSKVAKLGPSADQDKKSRELMKESAEYENGPAVKALNDQLFAVGRGLSDNELRRLIENKMPVAMSMQQSEAIITKLKDTLSDVLKAKNALLSGAVDAEKKAREGWGRSLKSAAAIDEDRAAVKSKVKQLEADRTIWKDNAKDSMRELGVAEEKVQALVHELRSVKEKLATTDKSKTEALIAMEVGKAKNWAVQKEIDTLKQELVALEKSNAKAVEKAKSGASEGHLTKLKEESKSQKARIKELEAEVKRKDMEAQKSVVEKDAAVEKASAKDRDLSELMKSLGDIQRSGMEREETANKKRQEAEAQVTGLERSLVDTKGELTVLKHEKASIAEGLEKAKKDLDAAETSLKGIREQVDGYKSEISSQAADLKLEKELRTRSELKEVEERNERIAVGAQMVAMTKEHAVMQQQLNEANEVLEVKWRKKMEEKEAMVEAREAELVEAQDLITGLEGEIGSLKEALTHQKSAEAAQHAETVSKLNGEIHLLNAKIKAEEEKLPAARAEFAKERLELENQIREGAAERRRMHNTIQELRGNVRVFARIRPFLPTDDVADNEMPCVIPKSDTELKLTTDGDERKATPFTFDRVFGPVSSQEAVFIEVAEFVQSALDGYNVTLFSYGQTGSGKTHTMQGSGLGQMRGIIPRAIEQVGEYKNELEAQGWKYEMQVSFLEIYNESIRDLLRGDDEDIGDKKHEIKVKSDGTRFVTDLTVKPLEPTDMEAVGDVMSTAAKFRTTKATSMNDVSSRSHSVFTLHLTAVHPETNKSLKGMLNLVDLAGSERIKRSGVTGDEAKEAVAINKSLSSLTNVFVSIGGKAGHIPFRNSKLTYLLQPSLSGDGKTLMIANLSPTEMSAPESLSSLRFASDVNKCELGQAKSSVQEINSDDEDDTKSTSSRGGRPGTSPKRTPPSSRSSSRGSASSVSSRGSTTRRTTPTARKTPPGRTPTKGTPSGRTSAPAGRTGRIPRPSSASKTPGNTGSRPAARKS